LHCAHIASLPGQNGVISASNVNVLPVKYRLNVYTHIMRMKPTQSGRYSEVAHRSRRERCGLEEWCFLGCYTVWLF
jgi:hypothetical protein